jgi:ssDNA-binding Zn-finger/Zn-ribbon topoisomerase 1
MILSKSGAAATREWTFYEAGWPLTALWGWAVDDSFLWQNAEHYSSDIIAVRLLEPRSSPRYPTNTTLPIGVHWPGIVGDTAIFTGAWCGLFVGCRLGCSRLRRRIRHARGRCPTCNYDRRGLPAARPCPECGAVPVTMPT